MKARIGNLLCIAAASLICAAPGFAAIPFELTGVTGGVMGGVYTSPYIAQIGSQIGTQDTTLVICDDFETESYLNDLFPTTETTVSALTGGTEVKFDHGNAIQQQADYATAAFLAQEIIAEDTKANPNTYQLGVLSFALWGVFDVPLLTAPYQGTATCGQHLAYGCLSSQQLGDAKLALSNAQANAASYSTYSNVSIYTPSPQDRSQEFLAVTVPVSMAEPPSLSVLAFYLLVVAGLAFVYRRRIA